MRVERGFNYPYPIQILREASGVDAFERVGRIYLSLQERVFYGLLALTNEFTFPLTYRLKNGKANGIPRDYVGLEIGLGMSYLAITFGAIPMEKILLGFGVKFGLNVLELIGADLSGYFANKRRIEERVRTEEL